MDRTDIKDMFVDDVVGGTSLSDDALEKILDQALSLLDRLTSHIGIDFISSETVTLLHAMGYYNDLLNRNYEASDKALKSLMADAQQLHNDYIQIEQADFEPYMGDRV